MAKRHPRFKIQKGGTSSTSNANERLARLEAKAEQLRKDIVVTTEHIGYSHMGGGFSMMEMAVALYYDFLNWSPEKVDDLYGRPVSQ